MTRFRLHIAYDGTAYGGWQIQPNATTVQAVLEGELKTLSGHATKVHGSGRTDRGVHAREQVAHVDLDMRISARALKLALNGRLPPDIRVRAATTVGPEFHARKSAIRKQYRYVIRNTAVMSPTQRLYETHIRQPLSVDAMRAAAQLLIGEHDFTAFSANPHRVVVSNVRHVMRCEVRKRGSCVTIIAEADGFLYRMVRSVAGWLIRVGEGTEHADATREILASGVRTARVPTAPPQGLHLWRVWY